MIRQAGIDFTTLPAQPADDLMGRYTGAATIFGVTGGVMEAALRTAYRLVTRQELDQIEIQPVRGMTGVRTASVTLAPPGENGESLIVKVAVAHGLGNARALLDEIRTGKSTYHLIEIMACPGGCVGGGGQPIGFDIALRGLRGETLYQEDRSLTCRRSHENSAVQQLYHDYLGSPLGEKSHHLLHTGYSPVFREGSLPASRNDIEMKGATDRR
jgi:NADH-quinone oxidoreductase subunit G